jgi:hypothetical protein
MSIVVINALFFRSGEWWVAQGLEYDIAAQGKTLKKTIKAFEKTLVTQILAYAEIGNDPYDEDSISKAPYEYFEFFEGRCRMFDQLAPFDVKTSSIAAGIWVCPKVLDENVDPDIARQGWNQRKL